jgi:predicted permease
MAVVVAALLPVFLLIMLGFVLERSLMRLETQWHGLERLTYHSAYVQMGGDAPLLAQIITLQTILAAITMPIAIALVASN